jgi:hypothetical protein
MDSQELRDTFHRVNAYRHVTDTVRGSAGHSFFSGLLFCGLAYLVYNLTGTFSLFTLAYFAIGVLELGVGFWKRIAPSHHCFLADAVLNFAFGALVLLRQALIWQKIIPGQINVLSLVFGGWALLDSYKGFNAWSICRKQFVERPTAAQMQYVKEMIADIREGQPETDETILDFSQTLDFKAQLLGELAFLLDRSGEVHVLESDDLVIDKPSGSETGRVVLFKNPTPPLFIPAANWRNYCRWKGQPET